MGYATQSRGKAPDYHYNVAACGACPQRARCTTARYRNNSRLENEALVERQAARVAAQPEGVAERKIIVEHVVGTRRRRFRGRRDGNTFRVPLGVAFGRGEMNFHPVCSACGH